MINVRFNNEMIVLQSHQSLADVLSMRGYVETHFAVAINRRFISRARYATTYLHDGDVIDIISPMQGG